MTASNLQIVRTLVAKDWRLFRVPMVALIIVAAGCYLMALAFIIDNWKDIAVAKTTPQTSAGAIVSAAAYIALLLTCLPASALGGTAIAAERTDRTSDFIGLLPVTRLQIVLSKLLSSFLIIAVFAAFHACVLWICSALEPSPVRFDWNVLAGCIMWIGCAICLLGVAWLFSTFMSSGPISACIAIGVTAVTIVTSTYLVDTHSEHRLPDWGLFLILSGVTYGVGLPSLIGGSLYYLRRVAP
jgi:ABC-type transport system involved in multi-copper enzyme maturation permease subunit